MRSNFSFDENTVKGLFFAAVLFVLGPLWTYDRRRRRKLNQTQKPPQT